MTGPVQILPKRAEAEREARGDGVHRDACFLADAYRDICLDSPVARIDGHEDRSGHCAVESTDSAECPILLDRYSARNLRTGGVSQST